mgnify:CR=1 FL=1
MYTILVVWSVGHLNAIGYRKGPTVIDVNVSTGIYTIR